MSEFEIKEIDLINAFGPHFYDGKNKSFTKNCDRCRFNINVGGEARCYYGKAFKALVNSDKLRKCALLLEPSPREMELFRRQSFPELYKTQRPKISW